MPTYPKHACAAPGCGALVDRGAARCPKHQVTYDKAGEVARGSSHSRGYDSRWAAARLSFLRDHPLCAECERQGRVTAGRVVDHIVPHMGDPKLFWDRANWQTLCDYTSPFNCHGSKTAKEANQRGR